MPEVIFPGPEGRLEGRFSPPPRARAPIALILHPHPQGGGTMNLEGMLYMPTQRIEVSGNGNVNGSSPYFAMVAKDFYFRGNGTFKMSKSTGGASAADIVPNLPVFATTETWISQ